MAGLEATIPVVRESVAAILRLHVIKPASVKKGRPVPQETGAGLSGSAFCVVADQYLATAYHILNGGKERDPKDKFYAFVVPQNGNAAYHFPVIGFPLERQDVDLAILEIGPCATQGIHIPALPVSLRQEIDGARVVTVGFPSPEIKQVSLDPSGNYTGGQFFLKSHANEGIVSAQYIFGGWPFYELNVGWHHGESGGPIVALADPPGAFSIMQHYHNIKSPHGVVAGPHRGVALSVIEQDLRCIGVTPLA